MEDIDKEQLGDPYANAEYAKEIFEYMREREVSDAWPGGGSPVWGRGDCVGRATCLLRGSELLAGACMGQEGACLRMVVSGESLTAGTLAGEIHAP